MASMTPRRVETGTLPLCNAFGVAAILAVTHGG